MAHFAELDDNNFVKRTIVIKNDKLLDSDGVEQESLGIAFCQKLYGDDTNWIQTSYNSTFRKKFATTGMEYKADDDIFIVGKPYPSWTLVDDYVTANFEYEPPTEKPSDPGDWSWDEGSLSWRLLN